MAESCHWISQLTPDTLIYSSSSGKSCVGLLPGKSFCGKEFLAEPDTSRSRNTPT
jgi:hypothetical protein